MQNFDQLNKEDKIKLSALLNQKVKQIGGKNFFLNMIETIEQASSHPLVSNACRLDFEGGSVSWNKVLFQDKIEQLKMHAPSSRLWEDFLAPIDSAHSKKALNLVRTLSPVEFIFKPKRFEDGSGFMLKAFVQDPTTAKTYLDPAFEAIFFTPKEKVKKILEFENKTVN